MFYRTKKYNFSLSAAAKIVLMEAYSLSNKTIPRFCQLCTRQ